MDDYCACPSQIVHCCADIDVAVITLRSAPSAKATAGVIRVNGADMLADIPAIFQRYAL